ncbi:MAG: hypothetical protein GY847_29690 [Proteobacteria bacterium]|nr:hypothetical protein [Pseudomonadota bacterium]
MRFAASLLLSALLVAAGSAAAEDVQPLTFTGYEFLENQYMFWSPQKIVQNEDSARLAFEAQVGPHLTIYSWQLSGPDPTLETNHELRLLFTFQTGLRMTTARSAPVITPSYMPKFRLQWLARQTPSTGEGTPIRDWRYGVMVDLWSHHSNGQDGCTFLPLPEESDGDCTSRDSAVDLNEHNGSFATNYLSVTGLLRHSWDATHESRRTSLIASAGLQFHHNFPFGGLEDDLRELWGRWHALVGTEIRFKPVNRRKHWAGYLYGRYRIDLMIDGGRDSLIPGVEARRDSHTGEIGWICTKLLGIGLFLRVAGGREYYNIQFTQDVTRFQFGLVIDTSGKAPVLEVRPAPPEPDVPPPPDTQAPPPPDTPPSQ